MCENNWVRKIARVEKADRRRMVELREETSSSSSLNSWRSTDGALSAGSAQELDRKTGEEDT